MAKKTQIGLTLDLTEKDIQTIAGLVDGAAPPATKVAMFANLVLASIASGAMLLDPDSVEQIREISPDLDNPGDIVAAIAKGQGVVSGDMQINWPTDPALCETLQQRAENQGVHIRQLLKDMMDMATSLGWFWDVSADVRYVFFSREEAAEISGIIGKEDFNSTDVFEFIKSNAPEDDAIGLFLEAAEPETVQA